MVDLTKVTNFNRTQCELEEFWLVAICVAGKNGPTQAGKVHQFLDEQRGDSPFEKVRCMIQSGTLLERLKIVKMGQYGRIEKAFAGSMALDLKTCTIADLTSIPGIGGKTSRFFLLHSRADCEHVVLDTHILRFLREECGFKDAPKSTPSSPKLYAEIEADARTAIRAKFPHDTMAGADLKIWLAMSGRSTLDIV
jgi:hypothetical protein